MAFTTAKRRILPTPGVVPNCSVGLGMLVANEDVITGAITSSVSTVIGGTLTLTNVAANVDTIIKNGITYLPGQAITFDIEASAGITSQYGYAYFEWDSTGGFELPVEVKFLIRPRLTGT